MVIFSNQNSPAYLGDIDIDYVIPTTLGNVYYYPQWIEYDDIWLHNTWQTNNFIPEMDPNLETPSFVENVYNFPNSQMRKKLRGVFKNIDSTQGQNIIIVGEPYKDYVTITMEIWIDDPLVATEIPIEIFFNGWVDAKVYQNYYPLTPYRTNKISTTLWCENQPYVIAELKVRSTYTKGLKIIVPSNVSKAVIKGLDQLENLEVLNLESEYETPLKIEGSLPKKLQYIKLVSVEFDDLDLSADKLKVLHTAAVRCEALTDIMEKIPNSAELIIVDPIEDYLPSGGQYVPYPWKFNLSGRVNLPESLLHLGLYGRDLTLEDLKALYNMIVDLPERTNPMTLFYQIGGSAEADYSTNVLEPMLNSKNITISEY